MVLIFVVLSSNSIISSPSLFMLHFALQTFIRYHIGVCHPLQVFNYTSLRCILYIFFFLSKFNSWFIWKM